MNRDAPETQIHPAELPDFVPNPSEPIVPGLHDQELGIVSASAVTFGASVAGLGLALIRSKLLALLIGPTGIALLANLSMYSSLAVIFGNSLAGQGAIKAIAEARATGRRNEVRWLVRYSLAAPLISSVVILAISAALASQISTVVTGSPDNTFLVLLLSACIPLAVFGGAYIQVLQAFLNIRRIGTGNVIGALALLAATVMLAIPFGTAGAVAAIGFGAAAKIGYLIFRDRSIVPGFTELAVAKGSRPRMLPVLQVGLSGMVLGIIAAGVGLLVRITIVATLGLEANGVYQPVADLSETYLEVVLTSIGLYLFPKVTVLLAQGESGVAGRELGHGMRLLIVVVVPIALVSIGFGDQLIHVLYAGSFSGAREPLGIQMLGNIAKVVAWSVGTGLLPLGMYRSWVVMGVVNLAIRYFGVVILSPILGLNGVAIAYVLAWSWSAAASVALVVFVGRLYPSRYDWRIVAFAASLVAIALVSAEQSLALGFLVSVVEIVVWLGMVRNDLFELGSEIWHLTGIRKPGSTGG